MEKINIAMKDNNVRFIMASDSFPVNLFCFFQLSSGELNPHHCSLKMDNWKINYYDQQLKQAELVDKLTEAIGHLNDRQRQIIILYYQQELTMKQIAEVFDITEPRVSQLHASALFSLSVKLRQWKDGR